MMMSGYCQSTGLPGLRESDISLNWRVKTCQLYPEAAILMENLTKKKENSAMDHHMLGGRGSFLEPPGLLRKPQHPSPHSLQSVGFKLPLSLPTMALTFAKTS